MDNYNFDLLYLCFLFFFDAKFDLVSLRELRTKLSSFSLLENNWNFLCIFFLRFKILYNKFSYLKTKFRLVTLDKLVLLIERVLPETMWCTVRLIKWSFDEFTVKI